MLPQGVLPMRSGADIATRAEAEMALGGALGNLFAVAAKISNAQSFAEFLATSRAAHFNRESHRLRPAALQRTGATIQYLNRRVPSKPGGGLVWILCGAAVRGGGGRSGERESAGLAAD